MGKRRVLACQRCFQVRRLWVFDIKGWGPEGGGQGLGCSASSQDE